MLTSKGIVTAEMMSRWFAEEVDNDVKENIVGQMTDLIFDEWLKIQGIDIEETWYLNLPFYADQRSEIWFRLEAVVYQLLNRGPTV